MSEEYRYTITFGTDDDWNDPEDCERLREALQNTVDQHVVYADIRVEDSHCIQSNRKKEIEFHAELQELQKENAAIKSKLEAAERERDAAVGDIHRDCETCKKENGCKIIKSLNVWELHADATGQCDSWQWRGPLAEGEGKGEL